MTDSRVNAQALLNWHSVLARQYPPSADIQASVSRVERVLAVSSGQLNLREYVGLLEHIHPTRAAFLAWEVGTTAPLWVESPVFQATLGCRTLGAALHWTCRFFPLLQDGADLHLEINGERAALSYRVLDPIIWPRHVDAVYTLALQSRLIRAACPDAWAQVQIVVEAEPPAADKCLASVVQAPVAYGGSSNCILFPARCLAAPFSVLGKCNPDLIVTLAKELSSKQRETSTTERTRQLIFSEMSEGRVNQTIIARKLGLSSRTLRRRLAEEDESFQAILDDCRMKFATLELRIRERVSLSEMALKLGYTEHATFSRAFNRWAGMPPRDYRRTMANARHMA
jgi:AraC-like DNA-binding protein